METIIFTVSIIILAIGGMFLIATIRNMKKAFNDELFNLKNNMDSMFRALVPKTPRDEVSREIVVDSLLRESRFKDLLQEVSQLKNKVSALEQFLEIEYKVTESKKEEFYQKKNQI